MFEELSYKKLLEKANEIELENKQLKGLIRNFTLLYSSMVEGVCLHEIVFGDDRKAVDYKILDVNPAYEEITQIKKEKAIGRLASDLYGTGNPPYLDIYATVAKSGVPTTFETYFPRHYESQ